MTQDRLLHPLEYLQRVQHENESETSTITWDMPVNTKKEINSINRPDIIIKDQELKKCLPAELNTLQNG